MFTYTKDVKKVAVETKAINTAIKAVHKSTGALAPRIQAAMNACAFHMVEHKDASLMTNLYNGLGNAINRKQGMLVWITAYTSLEYKKDKSGNYKFLGKNKEYTFQIEGEKMAFYEMERVKKLAEPFSLIAAFGSLVASAERKLEKLDDTEKAFYKKLSGIHIPEKAAIEEPVK
jgi:hypothetical protein